MFDLANVRFQGFDLRIQLVDVEAVDPANRFLGQFDDVLAADIPFELFAEGLESFGDGQKDFFPGLVFLLQFLIDLFLEGYFVQGSVMPFILQFAQTYFQLFLQQLLRMIHGEGEEFADTQELGLVVGDERGVGGNADFTVRKSIERIDGDVGGNAGSQVDLDLYFSGGIIRHFPDLDLSLVVGLDDRVDQLGGRHAIGNVFNQQGLFIEFFDVGAYADLSPSLAIIIVGAVEHASCLEVRVELEFLSFQAFDRRLAEFATIMRQDLGSQTDVHAFCSLGQQ